jgi:hypothetical protein
VAGFTIDSGARDVMFADNVDFSGATNPGAQILSNGQLLIGNAATPNIRPGILTSPFGTIVIGYIAPNITLDIFGGATAIERINVQTGTTPVVPSAGNVTFNGAVVAAGTNPVRTDGTGAATFALEIQKSQAIASADATKIGLSNFNSSQFSVDANGFVSSITGSFAWVDVTVATQTLAAQTGYVTDHSATVVYTLPTSGNLGDMIKIVGKLGLATITPNANQQILVGSVSGSVGITGTCVSNNAGDCIELVCITAGSSTVWRADSIVGTWTQN